MNANFEVLLQNFRIALSELVPGIIEECLWYQSKYDQEVAHEHYQLEICRLIKENFQIIGDLKELFDWFGLDSAFFKQECFKKIATFESSVKVFRDNEGGIKILEKIVDHLRTLDLEKAVVKHIEPSGDTVVIDH